MEESQLVKTAVDFARRKVAEIGSIERLPEQIRTVLLVVQGQGVIDNGGLQYFFEADWPGCPDYGVFVDAYRAIGATAEADALRRAVALFPFAEPHKHAKMRNDFMDRFKASDKSKVFHGEGPFGPITDLLCGNKNVWRCLDAYVAKHGSAFAD